MHVSSYTYKVLSPGRISRVRVLTPDQYFFLHTDTSSAADGKLCLTLA